MSEPVSKKQRTEVHPSGQNVDPANGMLYTNHNDTANPDGCVDTSLYKGSGRVAGKVAVVTGGSQAIGKTVVEVLAKEGAVVHFCGRRAAPGEKLEAELREQGLQVSFASVDVSDADALKSWMDSIGEKEGKIDVVVPNAACFIFGTIDEVTSDNWDTILACNVKGYANCVKFSLPWIRKTGKGGSVVMMASISSHIAQPAFVPYNTTKGAIIQMTRCMSLDLGKEKIRVNAVCPGTIDTPATTKHATNLGMSKADLTKLQCKSHFIKRLGSTLDCAYATLFLASDESTFVTGTSLMVDGGYTVGHTGDE
eukprot:TRINITY_DN43288_c0_g1_i2.p1 TRINITY_DN43288_c0_g1~~TRINITY_DN43288_c0_g1_i2.p1  ORF type:complete len:310 (+),score=84.57 TRINITY_DN43288_c0_g1_i2:230-1159(+)